MDSYANYNLTPPPPKKRRWVQYIFGFVGVVCVYVLIVATLMERTIRISNITEQKQETVWQRIAGIFGSTKINKETPPDPNPIPADDPNRINILILGIRGEDQPEEGGLLTDTIMILTVDKKSGRTALISIPRDLSVDMLSVHGKINQMYERGYPKGKGVALAREVVSRLTGQYIDHAIVFDFKAFQHIVDNIGGVDVKLAKPFTENQQWGYEFNLPAGDNHLTGEQALYYVRSRYSSSDFDRARRQQEVIGAIRKKVISLDMLTSPGKITALFTTLKGDIKTDYQVWEFNDAIELARSINFDSIKRYVLDTSNLLYETHNDKGEYILLPTEGTYDRIKELFKTIVATPTPTPLPPTIQITPHD